MIIFVPKPIPIGRYSAGWPKFRWPNYQNPQIKNPKITKNRFVLKFDLRVVAHSELVQNTSKTPIPSISDHISSLKSELPPKKSFWKFDFLHFYGFYVKRKVLIRGVPSKNSYLKVLPLDSLDEIDVFCTVPDHISTLGSKVMCF